MRNRGELPLAPLVPTPAVRLGGRPVSLSAQKAASGCIFPAGRRTNRSPALDRLRPRSTPPTGLPHRRSTLRAD